MNKTLRFLNSSIMSLAQLSVSSWDSFLTTEVASPKSQFQQLEIGTPRPPPFISSTFSRPLHPLASWAMVPVWISGSAKNTPSQHYPLLLLLLFPLRSLELHLVKLFWYLELVNTIYSRSVKILLVKRLQKCNFMQLIMHNVT